MSQAAARDACTRQCLLDQSSAHFYLYPVFTLTSANSANTRRQKASEKLLPTTDNELPLPHNLRNTIYNYIYNLFYLDNYITIISTM